LLGDVCKDGHAEDLGGNKLRRICKQPKAGVYRPPLERYWNRQPLKNARNVSLQARVGARTIQLVQQQFYMGLRADWSGNLPTKMFRQGA
jgi:hypothetical protein